VKACADDRFWPETVETSILVGSRMGGLAAVCKVQVMLWKVPRASMGVTVEDEAVSPPTGAPMSIRALNFARLRSAGLLLQALRERFLLRRGTVRRIARGKQLFALCR
jgi:hypothetical protein